MAASSAEEVSPYRFENWGQQALDFLEEVVQDRAFLLCNSVGGGWGQERPILRRGKQHGWGLLVGGECLCSVGAH